MNCRSRIRNSSSVTGSLSQAIVPSCVTVIVAVPEGSRGTPVSVSGSDTLRPWERFSDRVKRTNVARRKKMISINGMISIRARLFCRGEGMTMTMSEGTASDSMGGSDKTESEAMGGADEGAPDTVGGADTTEMDDVGGGDSSDDDLMGGADAADRDALK